MSVGDSGLNHELLPKASQRYGYFGNFSSKEFLLILLSRSLTLSLSLSFPLQPPPLLQLNMATYDIPGLSLTGTSLALPACLKSSVFSARVPFSGALIFAVTGNALPEP